MKTFAQLIAQGILGESDYIVIEGNLLDHVPSLLEGEETLEEAAGVLKGIPSHITKTMTAKYGRATVAGENSDTSTTEVKAKSPAHTAITAGLQKGQHVIIKHNGKVIGSIHPDSGYSGGRPEHTVLDAGEKGAKSVADTNYVRGKQYKGYREPDRSYSFQRKSLTRGEAISHAHEMIEKHGGYKGHQVEIEHIGPDKNRAAVSKTRTDARPSSERGKADQPKSLAAVTARAGSKLVDKYAGQHGAHAEAKAIHEKLGKAIDDGDHAAVRYHMRELDNHINSKGISKEAPSARWAKDEAKNIGERGGSRTDKYNYSAERFGDKVRELKGTSKKS